MKKNTTFIVNQIAREDRFPTKVEGKKDSSNSPLRNPFSVSRAQALRGILLLTQVFSAISITSQHKPLPKSPTAGGGVASGKSVGTGEEGILAKNKNDFAAINQEKLVWKNDIEDLIEKSKNNSYQTKTEEVDFVKIVEELLKFDPKTIERKIREERISKELSQRRQNLPAVNQTEIKKFIEEQKASNPNQPVDFSCYSGCQLVGSPFEVMIPGTSYVAKRLENVISDLDVHDTNFFKNINVDGCHFRGGNFSGCRFGDTIGVTFDGSDLTNADMSKTKQKELVLGGDDNNSGAASMLIEYVRSKTINQEVIPDDIKYLISYIEGYEKINVESKSTKFIKVNLQGSTLDKIESRYLTDFEGTDFGGVVLEGIDNFHGKNVKLNGAILKTSDGQIKNIINPITPEEIARDATPYVAAMLQNNVLTRKNGKTTTIALSKDCLGKTKQQMLDKGLVSSDATFLDPTEEDFKKILDLYNQEFKKFNVIFTRHKEDEPYDYFITFCHNPNFGSSEAHGRLDWTNQGIIALGNNSISTPYIQLHELGHILGAAHPFEVGIEEEKCSLFASVVCYEGAIDIMVPLDALSKYPARISPEMLENLGIQDKSHYNLIFGKNPDYQEQDITTNLNHDQIRIIDGDKNFKNIAHIDTTSLPKDIRYAVLDAKEAIGTCFKFPCDPKNIAEGIDEGTLVVFYTKNQSGGDEISGAALLFGGKTNNIFIDGKEVVPKRGLNAESTPTPTPAPTSVPRSTTTSVPTPAPTSTPKPATTSVPRPAPTSTPRPATTSVPRPATTSVPRPATTSTPRPATTSTPRPAPTSTPPAPKPTPTPALTVASTQTQLDPILSPNPDPSLTTPPEKSNKLDINLIGPLAGGAAALLIIMVILALKNRSRFRNNDNPQIDQTRPVETSIELTQIDQTRPTETSADSTPLTDAPQNPTNSDYSEQSQLGINAGSPRGIEISGGAPIAVIKKIPSAFMKTTEQTGDNKRTFSVRG